MQKTVAAGESNFLKAKSFILLIVLLLLALGL
jgi:hypothetical protein